MNADNRAEIEAAAVKARYERRAADDRSPNRDSIFKPDVILRAQARERVLIRLLIQNQALPIDAKTVLEVGCGEGVNLLQLIRLGFNPARMVGNDLRPDALEVAGRVLPGTVRLVAGDAGTVDLGIGLFDIVMHNTMFSSILDPVVQDAVARRLWALTKPGGAVLWYDFAYDNPRNPDVRGVPLARVRALFPNARIVARRVTLAPPLARAVAALHPALYLALDIIPWLRTHLLCWIQKP